MYYNQLNDLNNELATYITLTKQYLFIGNWIGGLLTNFSKIRWYLWRDRQISMYKKPQLIIFLGFIKEDIFLEASKYKNQIMLVAFKNLNISQNIAHFNIPLNYRSNISI